MGTAFGVPEDIDEDELMGELDALEDDLAAETAGGGGVPAYLQARAGRRPCLERSWQGDAGAACIRGGPRPGRRASASEPWQAGQLGGYCSAATSGTASSQPSHSVVALLRTPCSQDVDLPEVPQGQAEQQQAQQADDFGLPAIPQRT